MVAGFIIAFREVLEMIIILVIVLAYLAKTKGSSYRGLVAASAGAGLFVSAVLGVFLLKYFGGFAEGQEELFEGILMLVTATLVTLIVIWILKQKNLKNIVHSHLEQHMSKGEKIGIFLVVFFNMLREGVELVLLLAAASVASTSGLLVSSI